MMQRRSLPPVILALMALVLLAACGSSAGTGSQPQSGSQPTPPKASTKVIIGTGSPLTGPSAVDGQQIRDGVALAVKLAKANGQLANYDVTVDPQDDKSDPKEGLAIANRFASNDSVLAVIGHYNSSVTLAAEPILTKAHIVQISPGSSAPNLTGSSDYFFRTQTTDATAGKNLAQWAKNLGFDKAAILAENSDYGKGLEQVYKQNFTGQIVVDESYLAGQTQDFTPILTRVKDKGAQAILLGSVYTDAALIAKQAQSLGLKVTIFGNESEFTQGLIDVGKDAVNGMKVVGSYNPESKDASFVQFWNSYKQEYGKEPNVFAAQAYDAANIVLKALATVGPDRVKANQYIQQLKDYAGVTGKIAFVKGDVDKVMARFEVKNGKFVVVDK